MDKLIHVGGCPFEAADAAAIPTTREACLTATERATMREICTRGHSAADLSLIGATFNRADGYDPMPDTTPVAFSRAIHEAAWLEAAQMRTSGAPPLEVSNIWYQDVAIQGTADPHPAQCVRRPLKACLAYFRFRVLAR